MAGGFGMAVEYRKVGALIVDEALIILLDAKKFFASPTAILLGIRGGGLRDC